MDNDLYYFIFGIVIGSLFGGMVVGVIIQASSFSPSQVANQICEANGLQLKYYQIEGQKFDKIVCGGSKEKLIDDLVYVIE